MDKLSDLIKFRDDLISGLGQLSTDDYSQSRIQMLKHLSEYPVSLVSQTLSVLTKYQDQVDQYKSIIGTYKSIIDSTNLAIEQAGQSIIDSTILLSDEELTRLFMSYREDGNEDNTIPEAVIHRLYHSSNMKYPGLVFAPSSIEYIRPMVASDPLYLLGANIKLLQERITEFSQLYQNRLRLYDNIEMLPRDQFSLIFVGNFFHFIPYTQTIEYFKTMLSLLRPGGSILFTYHNSDLYEVAQLAEQGHVTYSSQTRLAKDCTELGYELVEFNNESVNAAESRFVSWAQLRRPGHLATVKRAQAIGAIRQK